MKNNFLVCPEKWAFDSKIKNELILLMVIAGFARYGECFASNEYFAEKLNTTTVSVSRQLRKLKDECYINIIYKKKGCSVISREIRLTKMPLKDYQKCELAFNKSVS